MTIITMLELSLNSRFLAEILTLEDGADPRLMVLDSELELYLIMDLSSSKREAPIKLRTMSGPLSKTIWTGLLKTGNPMDVISGKKLETLTSSGDAWAM